MGADPIPHEEHHHAPEKQRHAKTFDIYILGITIVIGGQLFSWNVGLVAGFWEYFFSFALTAFAYLNLVLCLGEMTSALPFSGGSYGFVRACIGPFSGYMIGCCEAVQNIIYVSATAMPLAGMLTSGLNISTDFVPMFWVLFFVTSILLNVIGGQFFWKFNLIIGLVSLGLILVYLGMTIQYTNFNEFVASIPSIAINNATTAIVNTLNTTSYDDYVPIHTSGFDGESMMTYFPLAAWFFIGVETLPLTCVDCDNPKVQIPWAMTACILTLIVTGVAVLFITCSQDPGLNGIAAALIPLNFGYMRGFGINDAAASWLAVPATYATGFGFMFVYGRQMSSMARSGLLPSFLKHSTSFANTPYVALMFGSLWSFLFVIFTYYGFAEFGTDMFNICMLCSYTIYISTFVSYFIFKSKYVTVARHFRNPLGNIGAVLSIGIFLIGFVSIVGYQPLNQNRPIIFFVVYLVLVGIYYIFFSIRNQKFSEEEQKAFFAAYLINANKKNRSRQKKNRQSSRKSAAASKKNSASEIGSRGTNSKAFISGRAGSFVSSEQHGSEGSSKAESHKDDHPNNNNGSSGGLFTSVAKFILHPMLDHQKHHEDDGMSGHDSESRRSRAAKTSDVASAQNDNVPGSASVRVNDFLDHHLLGTIGGGDGNTNGNGMMALRDGEELDLEAGGGHQHLHEAANQELEDKLTNYLTQQKNKEEANVKESLVTPAIATTNDVTAAPTAGGGLFSSIPILSMLSTSRKHNDIVPMKQHNNKDQHLIPEEGITGADKPFESTTHDPNHPQKRPAVKRSSLRNSFDFLSDGLAAVASMNKMVPLMSEDEFAQYQYRMVLQAGGQMVGEDQSGHKIETNLLSSDVLKILPKDALPSQRIIIVNDDEEMIGVDRHHHHQQHHHHHGSTSPPPERLEDGIEIIGAEPNRNNNKSPRHQVIKEEELEVEEV